MMRNEINEKKKKNDGDCYKVHFYRRYDDIILGRLDRYLPTAT